MNFKNKRRWKIIVTYCIGWTLSLIFLSIIRGVGATEDGAIDLEILPALLYSFTIGPVFGGISGYAQILTVERFYKRASLQKLLTIRLSISIAFLLLLTLISYLIITPLLKINISFIDFLLDKGSIPIYFYIITVDIFMAALWQVNLLLGGNNLWKILKGEFYTPHEEKRIFMFLDLQSSTHHAEKLGHIKYSMFIQDCFDDLGVVLENEAEIYQYVGDEVILTWQLKNGLRNDNCINAYFTFKKQLLKRQEYYQSRYNCTPFFKAGLNEGIVTATEVGKYKKEIAYHGDTINTAARIQGKCNDFNEELLVSENLKNKLNISNFNFNKLGSVLLRGKELEVSIFSVHLK